MTWGFVWQLAVYLGVLLGTVLFGRSWWDRRGTSATTTTTTIPAVATGAEGSRDGAGDDEAEVPIPLRAGPGSAMRGARQIGLELFRVPMLKRIAMQVGTTMSGTKAELIERILLREDRLWENGIPVPDHASPVPDPKLIQIRFKNGFKLDIQLSQIGPPKWFQI